MHQKKQRLKRTLVEAESEVDEMTVAASKCSWRSIDHISKIFPKNRNQRPNLSHFSRL